MENFIDEDTSVQTLLKSFVDKCKKEKIWYSLSNNSLLNAKSNKHFAGSNVVEIMMTTNSFKKLMKFYLSNIIDPSTKSDFYFTSPFYIEKGINAAIKINILIEANVKKAEKFYSYKNLLRQQIGFYKTKTSSNQLRKVFFKFMGYFFSPLTWQEISSNIYDDKYEGFFLVDNFSFNINKNWIHALNKKRETIKWLDIDVDIIKESEVFLIKKYGFEWKTNPKIPKFIVYFDLVKKYIND